MANIETHVPGSFCWIELATTDQAAAKHFYQSLFGWSVNDFPMGPDQFYSMFQLEGRDAAAAYNMDAAMRAKGVPPHWMLYIAVANADETAAKVTEAGGTVVVPPFDVFTFGRMSVLLDPTGAAFSIWQPNQHQGIRTKDVPGTFCWADLSTSDESAASAFYQKVFGWKISAGDDKSGYLHIQNGEAFIGGVQPSAHRKPNTPPHWLIYFAVADCDVSAGKARDLGAKFYMEPTTMEGVGRMAILMDPQGAVFSLFQSMRHS